MQNDKHQLFKKILTGGLILFALATCVIQVVRPFRTSSPTQLSDGVTLIFFHAAARCPECRAMEKYVRETFETHFQESVRSGNLQLAVLPYDTPENRDLAERFHVGTVAVVIVKRQNRQDVMVKNLAFDCWRLLHKEEAFQEMLRKNLEEMLHETEAQEETT
jgi:hypothetical protein